MYQLGEAQAAALGLLFEKVLAGLHADYALRYDLLRTHVLAAQHLQAATGRRAPPR
ncbi:hypothetical protein [Hymenobacter polaris]|uniref:hypothetical protein n=1 Tax=Hymenobacter polaris TaxID=2682546 RepID=UPI001F511719|nr:hypothetical protein [Hymenobacter polaris]